MNDNEIQSVFPESLDYPSDNESYFYDLTAEDMVRVRKYNELMAQGKNDEAAEILKELNKRKNHITADDMNKIINCIRAIETAAYPLTKGIIKGDLTVEGEGTIKGDLTVEGHIYGDADTVDGKHADDFLSVSGGKIYGDDEEINISPWGITGNSNSEITDFYKISASGFEENGVKLENKYLQIKDIPTSIPANGGNADTINGKHSYDFYSTGFIEAVNFNAFTNSYSGIMGCFNVSVTDTSNAPYSGINKYIVFNNTYSNNKSYEMGSSQIAVPLSDEQNNTYKIKYRYCYDDGSSGTWSDWEELSGNSTGSISGGNADTLGGKTLSEIQNYNNLTNKPSSLPANGGNADTVDNKHASDFYQCDRTAFKSGETILSWANAQSTNVSKGVLCTYYPDDAPIEQEGTVELIVFEGNRKIARFTSYATRITYIRTIFNNNWNTVWKKTEDGGNASTLGGKSLSEIQNYNNLANKPSSLPANGGNAESVNKKVKTFTVHTGSWYRLAGNNKDSCGGVFVLTVGTGGHSSTTVFSAAQQYSGINLNTTKLRCLSHATFGYGVQNLRIVRTESGECYLDFQINDGTDNSKGDIEVQFFGKGWNILDNIESCNVLGNCTEIQKIEVS